MSKQNPFKYFKTSPEIIKHSKNLLQFTQLSLIILIINVISKPDKIIKTYAKLHYTFGMKSMPHKLDRNQSLGTFIVRLTTPAGHF